MEWIANGFYAWIGVAIAKIMLGIGLILICGVGLILLSLPNWIRQQRCKHIRYHETMSCDAICNDCGKNLGFIGKIRHG